MMGFDGHGWMWGFGGGLMMLGVLILIGLTVWTVIAVTNRLRYGLSGSPRQLTDEPLPAAGTPQR